MWFPSSLAAIWLAAGAVGVNAAEPENQPVVKSIPVSPFIL